MARFSDECRRSCLDQRYLQLRSGKLQRASPPYERIPYIVMPTKQDAAMPSDRLLRVAPRDLFSEANFLKNLGRLVECAETGLITGLRMAKIDWADRDWIDLDPASGDFVLRDHLLTATAKETGFLVRRSANSRDPWPLILETHDWEYVDIFTESGDLSPEFLAFMVPGPTDIGTSSQSLYARSVLIKGLARVALDAQPLVGAEWPGFHFEADAFTGALMDFP